MGALPCRSLLLLVMLGGARAFAVTGGRAARAAAVRPFCAPPQGVDEAFEDMVKGSVSLWLQRVVVDLKLCPWATLPMSQGGLRMHVEYSDAEDALFETVMREARSLLEHPIAEGDALSESRTTLVIAPNQLGSFEEDFMPFKERVEDALYEDDATYGKVQLVTFHPRYRFGDGLNGGEEDAAGAVLDGDALKTVGIDAAALEEAGIPTGTREQVAAALAKEDAADYTNRAPFPMLQLLRGAEVAAAVESRGGEDQMEEVWESNVERMRGLGPAKARELLLSCVSDLRTSGRNYREDP